MARDNNRAHVVAQQLKFMYISDFAQIKLSVFNEIVIMAHTHRTHSSAAMRQALFMARVIIYCFVILY